ncbi:10534_t:CDS:2 [Entrophospora sp. SA101]|nr:10534_t:CDS:2 [Entrophospora sp. SA101]
MDPNAWGAKKLICEDEDLKDIKKMALELRDSFLMSPSQKEFSASLLERRLQIVWGPPVATDEHDGVGISVLEIVKPIKI